MARYASPMAVVPLAHAVTNPMALPCAPKRMAICPATMLMIMRGTSSGLTRAGPMVSSVWTLSHIVSMPPTPEPK